jgi:hypothetical protein
MSYHGGMRIIAIVLFAITIGAAGSGCVVRTHPAHTHGAVHNDQVCDYHCHGRHNKNCHRHCHGHHH